MGGECGGVLKEKVEKRAGEAWGGKGCEGPEGMRGNNKSTFTPAFENSGPKGKESQTKILLV